MRTQSEKWFEQFCGERGIPLVRIEETESRTPDYEINLDDAKIVVEVKEIQPIDDEKASIEKMRRTGVGNATGGTPGERVRSKIESAVGQIKARTNGTLPSLLIISDIRYGCGQVSGHVDSYNIRVAMDGLDQIVIAVPQDREISPYATGTKSGPRKKMTESHNTSISAIGVMYTPPGEPIGLLVYHNRFAANPINPDSLGPHVTRQYRLSGDAGTSSEWEEM